ncbi:hypothetical protein TNCT_642481 [Trichonephila clavata]|uniref:Uncharacterized protein n=1 Tax=Trichonephila clavata TaxID=2740835 RepID=A0A8X6F106_TRICU|nr:hypothetical protein TNCT_642481 [Trichonephila clavata]
MFREIKPSGTLVVGYIALGTVCQRSMVKQRFSKTITDYYAHSNSSKLEFKSCNRLDNYHLPFIEREPEPFQKISNIYIFEPFFLSGKKATDASFSSRAVSPFTGVKREGNFYVASNTKRFSALCFPARFHSCILTIVDKSSESLGVEVEPKWPSGFVRKMHKETVG